MVSTLERVHNIDISHDYRGRADLAVDLLRNGLDVSSVPTRSQLSSSKFSNQLLGMRGPITCFATRKASKKVLGVPSCNLYRL